MKIWILSLEELIVGAVVGLIFFPWLGAWALALALGTGFLWALGGAGFLGTKMWRRWGVPALLSVALLHVLIFKILAFLIAWGICAQGYGIPNRDDAEGSPLGRWCVKIVGEHGLAGEIAAGFLAKAIIVGFIFLDYVAFLVFIK